MRYVVLIILLAGCAGADSSSSSDGSDQKSIFDGWINDDQTIAFDFTGGFFRTNFTGEWALSTGETCEATHIDISGDEDSGTFSIQGVSYTGGGTDPNACGFLVNLSGTYERQGTKLYICGASCAFYQ